MTWTWRPQPTWTLHRPTGTPDIDLTAWVQAWDVLYGTLYDADSGRWLIQTATGSLTLDNRSRRFDLTSSRSLVDDAMVRVPQPVSLRLGPSGETLWAGLAVMPAAIPLRPADTVDAELRGRYWQFLRNVIGWRQTDNGPLGRTPAEVARRLLRDSIGKRGSAPASNDVSPSSAWPTAISLRDVAVDETGGNAWNRLAHALASIPYEDAYGRPGIAAMSQAASGRSIDFPTVDALDHSTLSTVGTVQLWGIDAVAKQYTEGAAATLASQSGITGTRSVTLRYDYPADVIGVEWGSPQLAEPGWTIVDWSALPAPDRSRADILRAVVRRDASARPGDQTISFPGKLLTLSASNLTSAVSLPSSALPNRLLARQQQTPPWIDLAAPGAGLGDYGSMVGYMNEKKNTATLHYPLWARTETTRLPTHLTARTGILVPGSVSRYRVAGDSQIDMITGLVHLSGRAADVPYASVTGWTYSGAATATHPILTGIPIPDPTVYPLPYDIPQIPDPTPTPSSDPAGIAVGDGGVIVDIATGDVVTVAGADRFSRLWWTDGAIAVGNNRGGVVVDVADGAVLRTVAGTATLYDVDGGVAVGQQILGSDPARIVDVAAGTILRTATPETLYGIDGGVAVGDGGVIVDVATGRLLRRVASRPTLRAVDGGIAVGWTASFGGVIVDVATGDVLHTLDRTQLWAVDGGIAVGWTLSFDGVIVDVATGDVLHTLSETRLFGIGGGIAVGQGGDAYLVADGSPLYIGRTQAWLRAVHRG